jgi:uncharacterized protein
MADVEKDLAAGSSAHSPYQMDDNMGSEEALRRIRMSGGLSISPELFEKIYLSPKTQVSNNLRTTFANPTPLYDYAFKILVAQIQNS